MESLRLLSADHAWVSLALILVGVVAIDISQRLTLNHWQQHLSQSTKLTYAQLLQSLRPPLSLLVWGLGLYAAYEIFVQQGWLVSFSLISDHFVFTLMISVIFYWLWVVSRVLGQFVLKLFAEDSDGKLQSRIQRLESSLRSALLVGFFWLVMAQWTINWQTQWMFFWVFWLVAGMTLDQLLRQGFYVLIKIAETKTHWKWDELILIALRLPSLVALWWWVLTQMMGGVMEGIAQSYMGSTLGDISFTSFGLMVIVTWAAWRLVAAVENSITQTQWEAPEVDLTLVTLVTKLLRLLILVIVGLWLLTQAGVNVAGLLAFGGLGGIAVGFAAKDLLANFFGGFMIYLDRPFGVGDWIRSPDKNIEGTVEVIGWRMTTIRTFDKRPLYVPNSTFSTISIENPSRMTNRRIKETFGVRYSDFQQVKPISAQVMQMLHQHPEIEQKLIIMAYFDHFGPSSLDLFVYCFTRTRDWAEYHRIKQDVLLKIHDIILAAGAEIAFPTQTLFVESFPSSHPSQPQQIMAPQQSI